MAPDLITLSAICHEDSHHHALTRTPSLDSKTPQTSEREIAMADPRARSLISMHITGFVFGQNQQHLVKALPWNSCRRGSLGPVQTNPALSAGELAAKMTRRGSGMGEGGEKRVVEVEVGSERFALLT